MRENFGSKIQFIKQIILRLIVIFLISQILYCASAKRYVANRGNDLKDIPIIGFEKNIYGINMEGVLPLGFQDASAGVGWGLRNGHLGAYNTGDEKNPILISDMEGSGGSKREMEMYYGKSNVIQSAYFYKPLDDSKDVRVWSKHSHRVQFNNWFCYTSTRVVYRNNLIPKRYGRACTFTTSFDRLMLDFSFGIHYGFRIGISGEAILDFVVGIFGFDPDNDDISDLDQDHRDLPLPIKEKKDWESKLDALDEKMDKRLIK